MDELYLENIDEFVNDHNKIVTYKWLSLTLGVHVNLAKQMLYHYLEQKRRDSAAQLHATYLVSGRLVENGQVCHKVSVVREDQLEDLKSRMSLMASVHVYSIQKAVLKDSGPLYSVDYDAVKENLNNCSRYSAISCADAVPRTAAEVQASREVTSQAPPSNTAPVKPAMNGHASVAAKPAPKQAKGIMGMFANKSAPKNPESGIEVKSEQKEDPSMAETSKNKPAAKTNAMTNFFGKQATNKSEKAVKVEEVPRSSVQPSSPIEKIGSPPQPSSPAENSSPAANHPEMKVDVKEEQPKNKKDTRSSKTKRLDSSNDEEEEKTESQRKKKRRRIKKPQPDSDDDVDVVPDSPRGEVVKDASPSSSPEPEAKREPVSLANESSDCKTRKRRRVLKSKTFVDEDGCIVTEKAYESESYSETEAEVLAHKPATKGAALAKPAVGKKDKEVKKTQKKAASSANKTTKQASIMGFFQKK